MSAETQQDADEQVQETSFNDASAVQNLESQAPDTQFSRFDELSSIMAFLERPTLLWQSRIDSSSPVLNGVEVMTGPRITQTPLKTFTFPSDLMKVGGKLDKILHFEWFKADVKLRILINANPFVAGRLWITYSPVNNAPNTASIRDYAQIENKGRAGITSYPGVELDLQTNTAAELLIPWIAETDAERADLANQSMYRVDIWMLTPLLVADNSLKIPIQVYGGFANVDLKFPTPIRRATTQSKKEAKGPIQEVASGVGSIAGKLKNVPLVGTVASAAEWTSNIVGGVASIFGWTRPIEGSHSEPFAHIPGRGMANFKAKDSSVVLGMANDNEIAEKHQNFISDVDEMDIAHICSRPGLVRMVDWSVSQDFNQEITRVQARREADSQQLLNFATPSQPDVRGYVKDYTLGEYVLNNFHMYRADWVFRISLVKTAFHVGRFEVFFVPNVGSSVTPEQVAALDTTNCYRQIFDITEQSEMTFKIPYMHNYIMMQRQPSVYKQDPPSVGTLFIRVVSPLTCPDTVSQSIKILVWKHAVNVALAHPDASEDVPVYTYTPSPPTLKSATTQINVTNQPKGTDYCVFNDEHSMQDNLDATTIVAGENCVNLRQATRGFREIRGALNFAARPVLPNAIDHDSGGYLGVAAKIFYFFRGGISYKLLDKTGAGLMSYLSLRYSNVPVEPFGNAPFHVTPPNNPIHEITVPFYSQTRRQVCCKKLDSSLIDTDLPLVALARYDGTYPKNTEIGLYMAGKDDLTFGFLLGPPLLFEVRPA